MTSEQKELTLVRLSSETVREATGRGWEEWLEALDAAGAADWNHGQIVAHLEREHREATTSWWRLGAKHLLLTVRRNHPGGGNYKWIQGTSVAGSFYHHEGNI